MSWPHFGANNSNRDSNSKRCVTVLAKSHGHFAILFLLLLASASQCCCQLLLPSFDYIPQVNHPSRDNDNSNYRNQVEAIEETLRLVESARRAKEFNLAQALREQEDSTGGGEIYVLEDKDYPKAQYEHYPGVGQVSGIAALPTDHVAIFHRSDREWTEQTFDQRSHSLTNVSQAQDQLIKNDTILIVDGEEGKSVASFGSNLFYLPHSVSSDQLGNLWVTDVGRHQVMRLPTGLMRLTSGNGSNERWLRPGNLSLVWPDIVLGEAFVPGKDSRHFCQPSEVAVASDGRLVYVADGYCNQRVMVFTGAGNYITSFGEQHQMLVVHSLALMEERNLICVADRENSRILCFRAGLDGDLNSLGQLVLSIDYPLGRVFAIATIGDHHLLVSSNQLGTDRYDLAALNPFTRELKQIWSSSDLLLPHSLASTRDRDQVYAADISKEAYRKVFKFYVIQNEAL